MILPGYIAVISGMYTVDGWPFIISGGMDGGNNTRGWDAGLSYFLFQSHITDRFQKRKGAEQGNDNRDGEGYKKQIHYWTLKYVLLLTLCKKPPNQNPFINLGK